MKDEVFVSPDLLGLFKESSNIHQVLNNSLQKFFVPIVAYAEKYLIKQEDMNKKNQQMSYFSIMIALEKFNTFIDQQAIEQTLLKISNYLLKQQQSQEQNTNNLFEEDINNNNSEQIAAQESLNNTKTNQNVQKFSFNKLNLLSMYSQVELLTQRKKLYGVKFKLHQFLSIIVSLCFNQQFLTNYFQKILIQQEVGVVGVGDQNKKVYSKKAEELFLRLTGQDLNQIKKTTTQDNILKMMIGATDGSKDNYNGAYQKPQILIEYLFSNFVLCKSKRRNSKQLQVLSAIYKDEMKWFLSTALPNLIQPLYDFYMFEQTQQMTVDQGKKFLINPIMLVEIGLRKFYEDFSPIFPRVSKEIFFEELTNSAQESITYSDFVILIYSLAQEQFHFKEKMSSQEKVREFMTLVKNHVSITFQAKKR